MNRRGFFITFEGTEGSGKSTQVKRLATFLRRQHWPVVVTHEPGGTAFGRRVRQLVLNTPNLSLTPLEETCLFMASRAHLVAAIIHPALRRGQFVLCDRFLDATLAYQGGGSGVQLKLIRQWGRVATQGLKPHLTFLLDIETRKGLRRLRHQRDRMESKSLAYHRRVRQMYRRLAAAEPQRFVVLDATQPRTVLQRTIREHVLALSARVRRYGRRRR